VVKLGHTRAKAQRRQIIGNWERFSKTTLTELYQFY
jgi:hypothetical protein